MEKTCELCKYNNVVDEKVLKLKSNKELLEINRNEMYKKRQTSIKLIRKRKTLNKMSKYYVRGGKK